MPARCAPGQSSAAASTRAAFAGAVTLWESTVSKILDLVENASEKKSQGENFITRFARYYTPVVIPGAVFPTLALALTPAASQPGLTGPWDWLHRALTFLVISCPCALVISVPLSFFGGIGGACRCGILVKGGSYLEALAKADTVVFDKTGTLTRGVFQVTAIHPEFSQQTSCWSWPPWRSLFQTIPSPQSLKTACGTELDPPGFPGWRRSPAGACGPGGRQRVWAGHGKLMERR